MECLNKPLSDLFSNEMILNFDMLNSFVINWILSDV